ncbi:BMP family ABC transporter substrate-binding protein [Anaerobacillus arseniciselenatis]|uniref:BMP family ABC transporter substrate-binding protein n=1 Tax=Anaerobacillus arseniciselenatis TaxID=85682 RepID=A0A1S2LCI7_9BACI|nr:ABC transporter substrate-binding protein [Anaerobacillus arseniciselenatis]OIJ10212.1 BMP family ABC transporter substrate-binding protein [Anaerobacillus arseniciselenatis]
MRKRLFISLVAFLFSLFVLTACGSQDASQDNNEEENSTQASDSDQTEAASPEEEQFKIGASQIVEHPSLDAAFEGFKKALADNGFVEGENVSYDFQSAQGDMNNAASIAQKFVADGVDLIFTNSTPSSQSALNATRDIPIIFTSVTDPVGADLVPEMNEPTGGNITGVSDFLAEAVDETVEFIATYFEGAKIGLIYNSGEQNSIAQIETVETAAKKIGLEVAKRTVSTSAEVQQSAQSLVGDVDVIYIITDNTVVSALETVVAVSNDYDIPLIVGEPDSLNRGGFATFGIDYFTIGYRSGEMAAEVLKGEKAIGDIPAESPPEMQLFINKSAAEAQGVEWNSEWDEKAQFVE